MFSTEYIDNSFKIIFDTLHQHKGIVRSQIDFPPDLNHAYDDAHDTTKIISYFGDIYMLRINGDTHQSVIYKYGKSLAQWSRVMLPENVIDISYHANENYKHLLSLTSTGSVFILSSKSGSFKKIEQYCNGYDHMYFREIVCIPEITFAPDIEKRKIDDSYNKINVLKKEIIETHMKLISGKFCIDEHNNIFVIEINRRDMTSNFISVCTENIFMNEKIKYFESDTHCSLFVVTENRKLYKFCQELSSIFVSTVNLPQELNIENIHPYAGIMYIIDTQHSLWVFAASYSLKKVFFKVNFKYEINDIDTSQVNGLILFTAAGMFMMACPLYFPNNPSYEKVEYRNSKK